MTEANHDDQTVADQRPLLISFSLLLLSPPVRPLFSSAS